MFIKNILQNKQDIERKTDREADRYKYYTTIINCWNPQQVKKQLGNHDPSSCRYQSKRSPVQTLCYRFNRSIQ